MHRTIQLLCVLIALACGGSSAFADCWTYFDPPMGTCTGAGGCRGFYPRTTCIMGCVSGSCNNSGNSTECCGTIHRYAQGYDDGQDTCRGDICGAVRVHIRSSTSKIPFLNKTAIPRHAKDALFHYQPPRILLIPNRCTRAYGIFFDPGFGAPSREGM
jgi:hypothetical protein